jgi:ribonuclease HI
VASEKRCLVFTDGACLNNGQENPKAGWAFVFGPGQQADDDRPATTSGRLETHGPFGDPGEQTSNRAELRAVIAALRFRHWAGEGWKSIVVATDSEYVVKGATEWARRWTRNGWKTASGNAAKNRDLWELLLGQVELWQEEGLRVEMWRVPRAWNAAADAAAKAAAGEEDVEKFTDISGILC